MNLNLFAINFSSIICLIVGCVFGILIVFLLYLLSVLKAINEEDSIIENDNNKEEIKTINLKLEEEIKKFKKNHTVSVGENISFMLKSVDVMTDFTTKTLYPNVKNPTLQITIRETIELSKDISNRVDVLLNKKPLRILKKLKISQIIQIALIKRTIDNNLIMKINKKFKISERFSFIKGILNFINPVYWIRKILMDTIINFILRRICICIIKIVTQETYRVYSKQFIEERV